MTGEKIYKLYAWAWKNDATHLNAWRDTITPKLGLIHYPNSYPVARAGDIAYVSNADQARRVVQMRDTFSHAILADERNIDGPSGSYETPEAYNERLGEAYEILEEAGVPTSAKGLAMVPAEHKLFGLIPVWGKQFDYAYLDQIKVGRYRGVNSHPIDYHRMRRGIQDRPEHKFFVTMIPWRWRWDFTIGFIQQALMQPGVEAQLERLIADERVLGVGLWCLHEGKMGNGEWQSFHGLLDRNDRLTWQGKMVKRILEV